MATLLHIDASAKTEGSASREVAAVFAEQWREANGDGVVVYRDLGTDPVPHLTEPGITAMLAPAGQRTPEQAKAWQLRETLAAELLAADGLLLALPMYNWGIPSTVKAWLDQALLVGAVLPIEPAASPLAGRPATVVLASGGDYGPGTPKQAWNHVEPYLRTVFGQALGMELELITLPLTNAPYFPEMAHLVPVAQRAKQEALATVRRLARGSAGSLV